MFRSFICVNIPFGFVTFKLVYRIFTVVSTLLSACCSRVSEPAASMILLDKTRHDNAGHTQFLYCVTLGYDAATPDGDLKRSLLFAFS
jgi:hypothetical protein